MKYFILLTCVFFMAVSNAAVKDPKELLPEVDAFLSSNLTPNCHDKTKFEMSRCETLCTETKCESIQCNTIADGSWGKVAGYNSLNCTEETFDVWFWPFSGGGGYQTMYLKKDDFKSAAGAIEKGFLIFTQGFYLGRCLDDSYNKAYPIFKTGEFIVSAVTENEFVTKAGLKIPVKVVDGTLSATVLQKKPKCDSMKVTSSAQVWLGLGIYQTEQVLKIVVDGKTIFNITATTTEL